MSDLYLVLRSRLDAVTKWVTLGTDVMKDARNARGLSYEAVSRQANVSAKTYERYEKRGQVPEHQVEAFAGILGLEIERPIRERVVVQERETEDAVLSALRVLDDRLQSLEAQVAESVKETKEALRLLRAAQRRAGGAPRAPRPKTGTDG